MSTGEIGREGRLAYREALPTGEERGDPVLFLHGFPETSWMWREALEVAARAGRRGVAPDLLGYGDSDPDPPATWERHVEALGELVDGLGLERLALVVHDWGGLIGLRWAVENPERISALLISDSGFFADGEWHGMAKGLRTEGVGEEIVGGIDREGFGEILRSSGSGFDEETIDEYFRGFSTPERRAGILELYRSGDFEKIAPYEGRLAELGVPTLLLWGESDEFAPVAGAYRFKREIPHAEIEVIEGAGHFVWSDAPRPCLMALEGLLGRERLMG